MPKAPIVELEPRHERTFELTSESCLFTNPRYDRRGQLTACTLVIGAADLSQLWQGITHVASSWHAGTWLLKKACIRLPMYKLPEPEQARLGIGDGHFIRLPVAEPFTFAEIPGPMPVAARVLMRPAVENGQRVIAPSLMDLNLEAPRSGAGGSA